MSKKRVAITRRIPSAGLEVLEPHYDLKVHDSEVPPEPSHLIDLLEDADAALILLSDTIDDAVFERCPRLKIVANMAAGYDNIDVSAAENRGIWVTNTPDVLTESTADLAMGLILAVARRIVEADAFMRKGEFKQWDPLLLRGMELAGKTLGIFGFGRIGQAVARRARAFGMDVIFTSRSPHAEAARELEARSVDFDALIATADVISVHTAYAPELRHRFSSAEFTAMKDSALFINTARGPLQNESDLLDALVNKDIAGAGLDVYEHEPRMVEGLNVLSNVVVLPHIGSATHETRDAMASLAARNVRAVLSGSSPVTPVNRIKE